MPEPKNTIKEVALKAGVSIATVSRFFSHPEALKERNRKKVEQAVKELNYQPLIYARKLAGGRLGAFGLIMPGYEGIFYSYYAIEIIRSTAFALDKMGLDLHLHIYWHRDNFKSSLVDGVIFADIIGNESQLKRLVKDGIPTVVMNHRFDDPGVNCVSVDNTKGALEAVEFLINHRHKRIAHLAGDPKVQCSQDRLDGYKRALAKHGIPVKAEYIKTTNFSRKEARDRLEELFTLKDPPTAVFCCSDEVAGEVLSFCEEKKIVVPREVSVIGFDDNPYGTYGHLTLTTVRQPLRLMATSAAEILRDQLDNKGPVRKVVLNAELIIRDTVAFL